MHGNFEMSVLCPLCHQSNHTERKFVQRPRPRVFGDRVRIIQAQCRKGEGFQSLIAPLEGRAFNHLTTKQELAEKS